MIDPIKILRCLDEIWRRDGSTPEKAARGDSYFSQEFQTLWKQTAQCLKEHDEILEGLRKQ